MQIDRIVSVSQAELIIFLVRVTPFLQIGFFLQTSRTKKTATHRPEQVFCTRVQALPIVWLIIGAALCFSCFDRQPVAWHHYDNCLLYRPSY